MEDIKEWEEGKEGAGREKEGERGTAKEDWFFRSVGPPRAYENCYTSLAQTRLC